jgi:hypothetical protein
MPQRSSIAWRALGRWLVVATPYRIANFLTPIAIVYVVGAADGYRMADLLTALVPLGEIAATGLVALEPIAHLGLRGRLGAMAVGALALTTFTLGMPWPLAGAGAFLIGASATVVTGELRRALVERLRPEELTRSLAVDSVAQEITWLIAPTLTSALVAAGARRSLLALVAASSLGALFLARRSRDSTAQRPAPRSFLRLLGEGRALWALSALEGLLEGSAVLAAVPLALAGHHTSVLGGIALSVMTLGSILGGSAFARWLGHRPARLLDLAGLVAFLAGLLALWALLPSLTPAWLVVSALAGSTIAPINALRASLVPALLPPRQSSDAYSVLYGTYSAGWLVVATVEAALFTRVGVGGAELAVSIAALTGAIIALLAAWRPLGQRPRSSGSPSTHP